MNYLPVDELDDVNDIKTKLLIYSVITTHIWTYDIQLFVSACKTNIDILQRFRIKRTTGNCRCSTIRSERHYQGRFTKIPNIREVIRNTVKQTKND